MKALLKSVCAIASGALLGLVVTATTLGPIFIMVHYENAEKARTHAVERGAQRQIGLEAGLSGVPAEACPWLGRYDMHKREAWLMGWAEGFKQSKKSGK